jgi:sugar (pentulose or hexulose) kinase
MLSQRMNPVHSHSIRDTIKATGGFAKSEVWRQMMADIFDTDVIVPESSLQVVDIYLLYLGWVDVHESYPPYFR